MITYQIWGVLSCEDDIKKLRQIDDYVITWWCPRPWWGCASWPQWKGWKDTDSRRTVQACLGSEEEKNNSFSHVGFSDPKMFENLHTFDPIYLPYVILLHKVHMVQRCVVELCILNLKLVKQINFAFNVDVYFAKICMVWFLSCAFCAGFEISIQILMLKNSQSCEGCHFSNGM